MEYSNHVTYSVKRENGICIDTFLVITWKFIRTSKNDLVHYSKSKIIVKKKLAECRSFKEVFTTTSRCRIYCAPRRRLSAVQKVIQFNVLCWCYWSRYLWPTNTPTGKYANAIGLYYTSHSNEFHRRTNTRFKNKHFFFRRLPCPTLAIVQPILDLWPGYHLT